MRKKTAVVLTAYSDGSLVLSVTPEDSEEDYEASSSQVALAAVHQLFNKKDEEFMRIVGEEVKKIEEEIDGKSY